MDFPCRSSNLTLSSWMLSPCHCDWLNIFTSLCSMYVVLLLIAYLRWTQERRGHIEGRLFHYHNFRAVLSILLFLTHLVELADSLLTYSPTHVMTVPSASLAYLIPAVILEHLLERTPRPGLLWVTSSLWALNGITRSVRLGLFLYLQVPMECLRPMTAAFASSFFFLMAFSEFAAAYFEKEKQSNSEDVPDSFQAKSYCHDEAHFLSKATFYWLTPLLRSGFSNPLEMEDLGVLPETHTARRQFLEFDSLYSGNSGSLWRAYWRFMKEEFCLGGLFKLIGDIVGLVGPLGISVIVTFVSGQRVDSRSNVEYPTIWDFYNNGWSMAGVIFVAAIAQSTFSQASTHLVNVRAIHLRAALQVMIYIKSLRLNNYSKYSSNKSSTGKKNSEEEADTGSIANLMSEDAFNIMSFFWIGHYVWAIPVKIAMLMYLLYLKLGVSAVIGAAITILTLTPLQLFIGKKMSRNASLSSEVSDERLQRVNTLIQGIRLFKLLAWEELFSNHILNVRKKEIELLDKDSLYWAVMTFFTHASSILVTLITFGVHYLLDDSPLSPEAVFAALALFNQLTVPLFIFPVTVPIVIAAVVSTRRLSDFLSLSETKSTIPKRDIKKPAADGNEIFNRPETIVESEEADPVVFSEIRMWINSRSDSVFAPGNGEDFLGERNDGLANFREDDETLEDFGEIESNHGVIDTEKSVMPESVEEFALKVEDGVFSLSTESSERFLNIKNIAIPKGKLTLVVGKVGSGKTSLLSAIMGELQSIRGSIAWRNNTVVAYCAQMPWLLNATVRDNILFGQPFRPRRYAQVLAACALQPDLDILPGKDLTEIGEKGINFSGGQKQRIAVARALYSKANFVVLDDPLSSLDYTVAMEVFEGGIKRLVRRGKRTVILVTHHLQLLAHCHMIIAMEDGQIRTQGPLNDIELKDRELIENWRDLMYKTDPASLQGRTARERWQLIKLVARIGRELRQRNSTDGSWTTEEETHVMSPRGYHCHRRFTAFSEWKYMTHDLPLPTDECLGDVLEGRSRWRKSSKKKMILRASSLQARHVRVPPVVRQYSSPLMSSDLPLRTANTGGHSGLLRQLFSGSPKLSRGIKTPVEEIQKKPVGRLLSTESGFSDATSEIDAEDWEEMDYNLGSKGSEEREYGRIPKRVYLVYIRACGTVIALLYVLITLAWQVVRVNTDFWLSNWTEASSYHEMSKYMVIYGVLSASSIVLSLASHGLGQLAGARARKTLHDAMLLNLVKCPIKLFESTPAGRMFNRFSTDVGIIDKKIATSIQRLMQFLLLCCSAIVINTAVTPWFLAVAVPVCLIYYSVQRFYRTSSRELQRLDSITRSPIFSHFAETLRGLSTIRAFGYQEKFTSSLYVKLNLNTNAFLIMNSGNRWLGIVLDYLGGIIVFLATMTSLISASFYPSFVTPSLVGLAINYTLLVPIYLNWVVKFLADCEMYMGAVERMRQFALLPTEEYNPQPALEISSDWPKKGDVRLHNVSLRYGSAREPVITCMNLHIPPGEKIGVCGRSGSGKSSLALSLFNMIEIYDGTIAIDGVDVTAAPLHILRSRISIIPQDVLLFSGSVRDNLDPTRRFSDEQLWTALERAQLKEVIYTQYGSLDYELKEGQSLSGGQRQLFCLARAILHGSSLLVMDEATSNLDRESEQILMTTAKQVFCGKTMVIIAHRLSTILDCDRIIVLDKGKIVEDGTPCQLLNKNIGIFSTMLKSSEELALGS